MKAWELLDKPEKWIKHESAKDVWGNWTNPLCDAACRWCAVGAIRLCYEKTDCGYMWWEQPDIKEKIAKLNTRIGMDIPISAWNDQPERTYEEVHSLLKELDI